MDRFPAYCRIELGGEYHDLVFQAKHQMLGAMRLFSHEASFAYLRNILKYKKIEYVIDAGANAGYMAMTYATTFSDADILALEPVCVNYKYLVRNASVFPAITPMQIGVSNKKGRLTIAMPISGQRADMPWDAQRSNVGLYSIFGKDVETAEMIEVDTLDNLATRRVDYLKLDIEGAEMLALEGAKRILTEDRPIMQIELRSENIQMGGNERQDYKDFFFRHKYVPAGKFHGDIILMPSEILPEVPTYSCFP